MIECGECGEGMASSSLEEMVFVLVLVFGTATVAASSDNISAREAVVSIG